MDRTGQPAGGFDSTAAKYSRFDDYADMAADGRVTFEEAMQAYRFDMRNFDANFATVVDRQRK